MGSLLGLLALVVAFWLFILPIWTMIRLRTLEDGLREERDRTDRLEALLEATGDKLESALASLTTPRSHRDRPTKVAKPAAPAAKPVTPRPVMPPAVEKPVPPAPVATHPKELPPKPPPPEPAPPKPTRPEVPVAAPPPPQPSTTPPRPTPPPPEPTSPLPSMPSFDWESFVGVKLFSAVAGIALVIASVFFLRYSIEQGWLQPPVRVAIGVLVGTGLLVLCELKAARRYPITANALDAGAVTVLFATFFSAHALWNLIALGPTFALLVLVTGTAVALSIRRESLFIAVLGLLGSFSVPALLSTGENRPLTLFGYLLLLNVGLAWVAHRRRWPILSLLTLFLTALYQWDWVIRFLTASQLPLAIGVFLLFPLVMFIGLLLGRGSHEKEESGETGPIFEQTAMASTLVPLLFAVYLASVSAYGARPGLLFSYLLVVDLGLLAVALARRVESMHAAGALTTLLVFAIWLGTSYSSAGWLIVLAALSAAVVLYLFAPIVALRMTRPFGPIAGQTVYASPLLLFVIPVLIAIEPGYSSPAIPFGLLFALAGVITWQALTRGPSILYFVAAFFAVTAQATWSALYLSADRLGTAIALYSVLGAFYLAVPVAARRWFRPLEPHAGSGVVLIASLGLLLFLSAHPVAPEAIWGLALLLAILNAGLFVESAATLMPALSVIGSIVSWVVLGTWWLRAATAVGLLPSLIMVAGLALLMLGGYARMRSRVAPTPERGDARTSLESDLRSGIYLAFIGHLFLATVAADFQSAVPPWPMFGVLALLTLAVSALSLYIRSDSLHAIGVGAASIILLIWTATATGRPWPLVGIIAAQTLVIYAFSWLQVARRARTTWLAPAALGAALAFAELVAIVAGGQAGEPPFPVLVTVHVVNLVAALTLLWRYRLPALTYAPLTFGWMAALLWHLGHLQPENWPRRLMLASAVYVVFAAFPFILGRRASWTRHPHIAAVLSSAAFLLAARDAFLGGGLEWAVGAIPILEAAILALLLRELLRIEPRGERDLGRLALVAGASLAFVTVAIPLQLREHWITIGWALEATALAWLFGRIPHRGLLYATVGLMSVVFVRLVNPDAFLYAPRGDLRILNWYLYTYAVSAAAFIVGGWWLLKTRDSLPGIAVRPAHAAFAAAGVILFLLLNIEIADFYATGPVLVFDFGLTLGQDLTYTIGWLGFGLLLLALGIYAGSHAARVAAIVLITVTTTKGFLYDLAGLAGLYRVGSFVGLAVALSLVALVLQKWVLSRSRAHT